MRLAVLADGRLSTSLGELRPAEPVRHAEGSTVQVLLRPDDVVLANGDGIEAEVASVSFLGAETLHTLRLPDGKPLSYVVECYTQANIAAPENRLRDYALMRLRNC